MLADARGVIAMEIYNGTCRRAGKACSAETWDGLLDHCLPGQALSG